MTDKTPQGNKKLFPGLSKKKPKAENPAPEAEKGNVFTSLFDEDKAKEKSQSDVVDSVMKKAAPKGSILGPKPKTDNVNIAEKPSHIGSSMLKLVALLWVIMLAASYLTIGSTFNFAGLNQSVAADENTEEVQQVQAELNTSNYLVAYYYLDSFAYIADSYLYKKAQYESDYTSSNTKASLEPELEELEDDLMLALSMAQEQLSKPASPSGVEIESEIGMDILFKEATKTYIEAEITKLEGNASDPDVQVEITGLEGALALISNGAFVKEIVAADITSVEELVDGLSEITSDTFNTISKIKSDRNKWSEIIQEIETITKKVDPLYNTSVQSYITYTSFSFDAESKTILIQGDTLTDDTRNFTLIVNLVEELEQAEMFANVEERSFTKSESSSDDDNEYQARFRLEFEIQEGEDDRDASFVLTSDEDQVPSTEESEEDQVPSTEESEEDQVPNTEESEEEEPVKVKVTTDEETES